METGKSRGTGHTWEFGSGVCPALLTAVEGERRHGGLTGRLMQSQWVLDYSISASGLCRVGGRARPWLERGAGVAHLYPPHTPYWEDTRSVDSRIHSAYVILAGGEACGLDSLVDRKHRFGRFLDPEGLLEGLLRKIAWTGSTYGKEGYWHAQSLLLEIIHLLHHAVPVEAGIRRVADVKPPAGKGPFSEEVRRYLEMHLAEAVTLKAVAQATGVSLSTLSHRYRTETGESPMAALIRLRVNTAKGLLLRGYPLKHIAGETGFCDIYHLSKMFKRVTGLSPRAFLHSLAN